MSNVEPIIRRKINNPWTQAPKAIVENEKLTVEARWLLVYLLGKPDGWTVRPADIQNKSGWGRDKTRQHIRELVGTGYLLEDLARDEEGRFTTKNYILVDEPTSHELKTSNWKPVTGEPAPANQSHTKKENFTKTEYKSAGAREPVDNSRAPAQKEFQHALPEQDRKAFVEKLLGKAVLR